MSFIVEDGTKVAGANSYVPVAYADAYFSQYSNAIWTGLLTSDKQAALITATQSVDLLYGQRYKSMPASSTQSLLWPRFVVIINRIQIVQSGTIPAQLMNAVSEVALMANQGINVFPVPNTDAQLKQQRNQVGTLVQDSVWGHTPKVEKFAGFNKIDLILYPLLNESDMPASLAL